MQYEWSANKSDDLIEKKLPAGSPDTHYTTLLVNYLEATNDSQKNTARDAWMEQPVDSTADILEPLGGLPVEDVETLTHLPSYSFLLKLNFRLEKPYISKDDTAFHVIDNPVRKEWLFRVPAVASTSWKGALRAAFWQQGYGKEDPLIQRLFGHATNEGGGQRGWLVFFPTYFDAGRVGIEMINPHARETGIGKNPIPFESVRENAPGVFWLLYAPLKPGRPASLVEDLRHITSALSDLLTVYGVGAKVSSGYGMAQPLGGRLFLRATIPPYTTEQETPAAPTTDQQLSERDQWLLGLLDDGTGAPVDEEAFLKRLEENWPPAEKLPKNWKNYQRQHRKLSQHLLSAKEDNAPDKTDAAKEEPLEWFAPIFSGLEELNAIVDHIDRHLPSPESERTEETT